MVVMDLRGLIILYPRSKGKGYCEKSFKLFRKFLFLSDKPGGFLWKPPGFRCFLQFFPGFYPYSIISSMFFALSWNSSIQSPVMSV